MLLSLFLYKVLGEILLISSIFLSEYFLLNKWCRLGWLSTNAASLKVHVLLTIWPEWDEMSLKRHIYTLRQLLKALNKPQSISHSFYRVTLQFTRTQKMHYSLHYHYLMQSLQLSRFWNRSFHLNYTWYGPDCQPRYKKCIKNIETRNSVTNEQHLTISTTLWP